MRKCDAMHGEVYLPLMCTLAVVVVADCEIRTPDCQTGNFYDINSRICRPCSVCPEDQIVRRPCTRCHDVFCGHFVEFGHFNQHSGEQPLSMMNSTVRSDHGHQNGTDSVSTGDSWRELSVALVVVLSVLSALILGIVVYVCWRRRRANSKGTSTVLYQRGSHAMHGEVSPEDIPRSSNQEQPEARFVFV